MKKIFDYFFLLRPSILIALWTFYFAGVYIAFRINNIKIFFNNYSISHILIIMFFYTLLMGSVYIINQIVDRDTDKLNNKLFLLSEGYISVKSAIIYLIILFIISIIGIFLIYKSSLLLLLFLISYIMGVLYSVKPFVFKRRPFLDLLDNTLGYGFIAILTGFYSVNRELYIDKQLIIYILPYLFAMAGIFVNTTIMDYEGDKSVNAKTTAVFLGIRKSAIFSVILMFCSVVFSYIAKDMIILIASFYSLLFFLFALIKNNKKIYSMSVKFTAPILTLFFSIAYYYLFVINIIVFISMIIYYKKRFNLDIV